MNTSKTIYQLIQQLQKQHSLCKLKEVKPSTYWILHYDFTKPIIFQDHLIFWCVEKCNTHCVLFLTYSLYVLIEQMVINKGPIISRSKVKAVLLLSWSSSKVMKASVCSYMTIFPFIKNNKPWISCNSMNCYCWLPLW